MKKLFTVLVASVCGTMAYAQSGAISVSDVSISKGGTAQMEVSINNAANQTAFQFDLAVPTGYSVKGADFKGTYGESRHLLNGEVGGKLRFLSYDDGNAKLADGEKVIITLQAGDDAATGQVSGSDWVIVTPTGDSNSAGASDNITASITISEGISIDIPAGKNLAMVSDKNLDFTSLEAKGVIAYICTGYEVATKRFWLMQVTDVPANTPILVKGEPGTYDVPAGSAGIYYPSNYLKGDATAKFAVDKSEGYLNFAVSKKTGSIGELTLEELDAGKAYFHVPASVTSKVTESVPAFTMGAAGKLAIVNDFDIDISGVQGLAAYVVTGFEKNRSIWMMPVTQISAGTPVIFVGDKDGSYPTVPSVACQMAYISMLNGNNTSETITLNPTEGDNTIYAMSKKTGIFGILGSATPFSTGKVWMEVPTWFHQSLTSSSRGQGENVTEHIANVIYMEASNGIIDDEATGISRIATEGGDDAWYNLSGQRISTPTKKGLYIRGGKKVIVK